MPSKNTIKHPLLTSPHPREEFNYPSPSTRHETRRFGPVHHVREQGPTTKARFQSRTHRKYAGFHPKPAKPKPSQSEDQLAKGLSEQLQSNIQEAANNFSAQIVKTANELANNASDAVKGDVQSAAGAVSDAIAKTSSHIEVDIENTAAQLGEDIESAVTKYLTPKYIEDAAIMIVHNLAHAAIGAQHLLMPSSHPNDADEREDEEAPLLQKKNGCKAKNYINFEHWINPHSAKHVIQTTKEKTQHWLSSKAGHYFVLTLVALDVASIVAGKFFQPPAKIYPMTCTFSASPPPRLHTKLTTQQPS